MIAGIVCGGSEVSSSSQPPLARFAALSGRHWQRRLDACLLGFKYRPVPVWGVRQRRVLIDTEIRKERERADALRSKSGKLGFFEQRSLRKLAESYALKEFDDESPQHWNELLKRVNTVPPSLALAQAANESAWGTSRFAQEGNNYPGQWCFERGCGLVPIEQYDR